MQYSCLTNAATIAGGSEAEYEADQTFKCSFPELQKWLLRIKSIFLPIGFPQRTLSNYYLAEVSLTDFYSKVNSYFLTSDLTSDLSTTTEQ